MKRSPRIERFRFWKVNPAGVAKHDARREWLIDLIQRTAIYFDIEVTQPLILARTTSFLEALRMLAQQAGLKVIDRAFENCRLPIVARDKSHDEAVLLLPEGRSRYRALTLQHEECIKDADIMKRFDEFVYLCPMSEPYDPIGVLIKQIASYLPQFSLALVTLALAFLFVAFLWVTFWLQSAQGEQNQLVLIIIALGFVVILATTANVFVQLARKNFCFSSVWLFDHVFRRLLLSPERAGQLSFDDIETLRDGLRQGLHRWFFVRARFIAAISAAVVMTAVMFAYDRMLCVVIVSAAVLTIFLASHFQDHCRVLKKFYVRRRERLFETLVHYDASRSAIYGLRLENRLSDMLRLSHARALVTSQNVEERARVLKIAALVVPCIFFVGGVVVSLRERPDTVTTQAILMLAVILLGAGYVAIFLGMHRRNYFGFDEALLESINTLPQTRREARVRPVIQEGGVLLLNVNFSYDDSGLVIFTNLNLRVVARDCIVLCGPSGSGKTTLLKILCGLCRPQEGEVIFDGQDVRALDENALRQSFGVVFEDTDIFPGSIYNNIVCGRTIAAKLVQNLLLSHEIFDVLLDMPMALETYIVDNGKNISRLERVVILLARALLHDPRYLFLDDIFASLSLKDQAVVADFLASLSITRIITSHGTNSPLKAGRTIFLPMPPLL